jgi:hypothetical protein
MHDSLTLTIMIMFEAFHGQMTQSVGVLRLSTWVSVIVMAITCAKREKSGDYMARIEADEFNGTFRFSFTLFICVLPCTQHVSTVNQEPQHKKMAIGQPAITINLIQLAYYQCIAIHASDLWSFVGFFHRKA